MSEVGEWYLEKRVERTVKSLKENGFETIYASTGKKAVGEILKLIKTDDLVGVPGSITVRELGLVDALNRRGNSLAIQLEGLSPEEKIDIRRQHLTCDVLLTGSNAITESGMLVNTDGAGNRVAAMIFGPKKVIVVAGVNKIVKDLDAAIERVDNAAAPMNAKRLNRDTPCAVTGVCTDCKSPKRICNVTTIIKKKPSLTDVTVVLVGKTLGY